VSRFLALLYHLDHYSLDRRDGATRPSNWHVVSMLAKGHWRTFRDIGRCPLCPQSRTSNRPRGMSANGLRPAASRRPKESLDPWVPSANDPFRTCCLPVGRPLSGVGLPWRRTVAKHCRAPGAAKQLARF
jgi:hypothetical protein